MTTDTTPEVDRPEANHELLPCPFCLGASDITSINNGDVGDGYMWRIYCAQDNDCPVQPEIYRDSEKVAVAHWNTRASFREWQPIETAPTTGKAFLVWCPDRQNTYQVFRRADSDDFIIWGSSLGAALGEIPTHWMPLPDPPQGHKGTE